MTDIEVTWLESWGDCDHAGCSGPEIVTIIAVQGDKKVTVEHGSCFGVNKEELIAELLTKWSEK